jgi:hypothetical protein
MPVDFRPVAITFYKDPWMCESAQGDGDTMQKVLEGPGSC